MYAPPPGPQPAPLLARPFGPRAHTHHAARPHNRTHTKRTHSYVGNLHPCVTVSALQEICTYLGPVEQVKVVKVRRAR